METPELTQEERLKKVLENLGNLKAKLEELKEQEATLKDWHKTISKILDMIEYNYARIKLEFDIAIRDNEIYVSSIVLPSVVIDINKKTTELTLESLRSILLEKVEEIVLKLLEDIKHMLKKYIDEVENIKEKTEGIEDSIKDILDLSLIHISEPTRPY